VEGLHKAAMNGSKTELFLLDGLRELGWIVEPRMKIYKITIDLFLRGQRLAVFVDGPGHHLPIWGWKKLARIKEQDSAINEKLLDGGYSVLRIINIARNLSDIQHRTMLQSVVSVIESNEIEHPKLIVAGEL
jgi:very-short-patch-repair endonuclease